ncbi:MAG: hypothetical protein OQK73_10975 [Gammaproteobacteria bacterium]|nr:hypothetical protein [Gammaproteobacteria bacterium]
MADIFDALTSNRPYKSAWSNADALDTLKNLAIIEKLDPDCVDALCNSLDKIEKIQTQFTERFR